MESTINERLKILMNALGTNPNALAKVLGLGSSTMRNYIDRESKPGYDVLEKLYHSFEGINLDWLFGGPGSPLHSQVGESTTGYQSQSQNQKKNRGTITNHQNNGPTTYSLDDCARERDQFKATCASQQQLIEQLQLNLQDLRSALAALTKP